MKTYPYSDAKANETSAGKEPITGKQIVYIFYLSRQNKDKDETLNAIMDSIPGDLDIEDLSKG